MIGACLKHVQMYLRDMYRVGAWSVVANAAVNYVGLSDERTTILEEVWHYSRSKNFSSFIFSERS